MRGALGFGGDFGAGFGLLMVVLIISQCLFGVVVG